MERRPPMHIVEEEPEDNGWHNGGPTIEEIEASIEKVNAEIREIRARSPEFVAFEKSEKLLKFCENLGLKVTECR